jgi:hypothetical protein
MKETIFKKKYSPPTIAITTFRLQDVIMTSVEYNADHVLDGGDWDDWGDSGNSFSDPILG